MKLRLTVQRKEYLMSISENIRFFRKEANLTQKDLARKCGLAEITVRQYESGKREPRSSQLAKIAGALNISAVDLYLGQRIEYTDLRSSDTRYRNRLRAYKNVGDVPFTEDQKIRTDLLIMGEILVEIMSLWGKPEPSKAPIPAEPLPSALTPRPGLAAVRYLSEV